MQMAYTITSIFYVNAFSGVSKCTRLSLMYAAARGMVTAQKLFGNQKLQMN